MAPEGMRELIFHAGNEILIFWILIIALVGTAAALLLDFIERREADFKSGRRERPKSPYNDDDGPPFIPGPW